MLNSTLALITAVLCVRGSRSKLRSSALPEGASIFTDQRILNIISNIFVLFFFACDITFSFNAYDSIFCIVFVLAPCPCTFPLYNKNICIHKLIMKNRHKNDLITKNQQIQVCFFPDHTLHNSVRTRAIWMATSSAEELG